MTHPRAPDPAQEFARLEGEAHVWLARPDEHLDPALLEGYHALLSPEEHERARRFVREPDRHHFLVAHALVRSALSRYAEVRPAAWEFEKGEHDKPEVSGPSGAPPLRFNLSHTSGLVACVICTQIDCGIDVECVGRVKDLAGVAKRVLSEGERRALFAREGPARDIRFTEYWTLKEAYAKARGLGFQLPVRAVRFDFESSAEAPSISFGEDIDDRPEHWQVALQPISDDHRLAVALRRGEGPDRELVLREQWPRG
ncbi:MAG: 4'-phosphopantetheinyl transferase superfamily protein [Deltaproteobacteria bacterium]|nr:4'-phosphopantetheinyl transferase superfamily protein [Deltaproteobacteria bacterium]